MAKLSRLDQAATLDDVLLYRISRLLGVAGSLVIRLCEGRFGITRREWRLLALLAQSESQGLLSSDLAERAQLDRPRTSKAVSSLVTKKLLRRETRPADRRQAMLALTEAGRRLYAALFPLVVEINQDLLAALSPLNVRLLDQNLDALQLRADAMLVAHTELPKADRRRGSRQRRLMG